MIGLNECAVDKVAVKVKTLDGHMLRCCRITLSHQFDDSVALDLGEDGRMALEGLSSGAFESVMLNIGNMKLLGEFRADDGDKVEVPHLLGIKAKAVAAKDPSVQQPRIAFEFEFIWQSAAWSFFGAQCSSYVRCDFKDTQTSFDFVSPSNRVADAAGRFVDSLPAGTTVEFSTPTPAA